MIHLARWMSRLAFSVLVFTVGCGGDDGPIRTAPVITTHPQNLTVKAGESATFTVAASGQPAPTFAWERSSDSGATWTAVQNATAATYSFVAQAQDEAARFRAQATNVAGSAVSTAAQLTVQVAPSITIPPQTQAVTEGDAVTFTVQASGTAPLHYQWQHNGAHVGSDQATFIIPHAALADAGDYRVTVSNMVSSVTSALAQLTVAPLAVAPTITQQPQSQQVSAGSSVTFTVEATGTLPLHYQWKHDGANVGSDSASLVIASAQSSDAGDYTVAVSNGAGSAQSATATLTVNTPAAEFTRTVPGTPENITGLLDPLWFSRASWQNLYRASQISGAGYITGISIQYLGNQASATSISSLTIRLGHTTLNALTSDFGNNINNGSGQTETVVAAKTFTFPAGLGRSWHRIDFETPFYYNGVDNLVIWFEAIGPFGTRLEDACDLSVGYNATLYNNAANPVIGSLGDFLQRTQIHFKGGESTPVQGSMPNSIPFSPNGLQKVHVAYTPDQIGGSGYIHGFAIQVGSTTTSAETYSLSMRIGHTSLDNLSVNFADNFNSGTPTTVCDHATVVVPAGMAAGSRFWVPWKGPAFHYNGTDKLLVELDVSSGTGATNVFRGNPSTGTVRVAGTTGSAVGTVADNVQIGATLRFQGSKMDVITSGVQSVAMPFLDHSMGSHGQHLYRATELGTKGLITKLGLRMHSNTGTDATFDNVVIRLGHNAHASGLSATFDSNLVDAVEVYRGPVTVPGSIRYGDWLEIPLTTAFPYDVAKDLVVEISCPQGTALYPVSMSGDTDEEKARFAFCHAAALGSQATTATVVTWGVIDLRLVLK